MSIKHTYKCSNCEPIGEPCILTIEEEYYEPDMPQACPYLSIPKWEKIKEYKTNYIDKPNK